MTASPKAPDSMRRWKILGLLATLVIVISIPIHALRENAGRSRSVTDVEESTEFVGREICRPCHEIAYSAWSGSDHDHAMEVASDSTVLGDFNNTFFQEGDLTAEFYRRDGGFFVRTQGSDGALTEYEIAYTFGYQPLQQYLIPFPGGRLQSLTVAWNTERKEWFFTYQGQDIPPEDWLHWTRAAQNWNGMCAECHSTNLQKGYDPKTRTFSTTWSEIDVSCEACHGPSSRHVAWAEIPPMGRPEIENFGLLIRTGDTTSEEQVELCAPCHSRRTEFGDYDHTRPALMDTQVPALLDDELYFSDGQIQDEVYVYGSFVQSKMYRNDVACGDCHDVHTLKLRAEGNDLCLQCHGSEDYDAYDHHFHKKVVDGKPSDGALCVKCHMPERPYMVVDWRADHSIRVPRPDLTLETGVPNACSQGGCHDDRSDAWSADHYRTWYGISRKPHYGTDLAAGRAGDPEALERLVRLAGDPLYPGIVRATALSLLSADSGEPGLGAYRQALSDEEVLVRYTAVSNLNISRPERYVDLVAPLLFDGSRLVRMQAAAGLAGLPVELFKPYQWEGLTESLIEYEEAMQYGLDFAFANHNLGNLYMRLGGLDRAEHYFGSAVEIDDLFYPAKVNLAMLYNSQGRNEDAEKLMRQVIDADEEQYEVAYSLALLLVEIGRQPEALEYLRRASAGMPDRSRVHYNLGLLLQQEGELVDAEVALLRAEALEPQNPDFLLALADHYLKRDDPEKALPFAARLIVAQPDSPVGQQVMIAVRQALGMQGRK